MQKILYSLVIVCISLLQIINSNPAHNTKYVLNYLEKGDPITI